MKETTDIQQFQSLFASWLEAGTSLEQEQELLRLALRLLHSGCDEHTRRDAELVKLSMSPARASGDAAGFSSFIDSLTKQKAPRRRCPKWLRYAVAAVIFAIVAGAGVKMMMHTPEPEPTPDPVPEAMPATTLAVVAPQPIAAEPAKSALSGKSEKSDRSDKSGLTVPTTAAAPEQVLEPRVITDPQEAADVLGKSCSLLADCVQQAEQESQKALGTFAENINLVNEII